jgi:hypothetical protein
MSRKRHCFSEHGFAPPGDSAVVFEIRVQTACLDFRISKTALKVTRSVCLRAF